MHQNRGDSPSTLSRFQKLCQKAGSPSLRCFSQADVSLVFPPGRRLPVPALQLLHSSSKERLEPHASRTPDPLPRRPANHQRNPLHRSVLSWPLEFCFPARTFPWPCSLLTLSGNRECCWEFLSHCSKIFGFDFYMIFFNMSFNDILRLHYWKISLSDTAGNI